MKQERKSVETLLGQGLSGITLFCRNDGAAQPDDEGCQQQDLAGQRDISQSD
jgi:hypothetical protein